MEIREDSTLARVKVNMLSRVVTLIGDDGELIDVENNNSEEFINMCSFINETLPEIPHLLQFISVLTPIVGKSAFKFCFTLASFTKIEFSFLFK